MDVTSEEPINLIQMHGKAYVWNSTDWRKLQECRVVGCFVGNLATLSKQDRLTGLPLALLDEETTLLLEKGFARLKSLPKITQPPDDELRDRSREHRETILQQQVDLLKRQRKEEIASKIDVIVEGKLGKRRSGGSEKFDKDKILEEEFRKVDQSKESTLAIQICTSDPWIKETDIVECSWSYPKKTLNYLVFKDLWERGYYITLGGKFGGDYLAYPGHPIKFHAFFIVVCLERHERLKMQDIITYGRLGQSVKKTVVLAYLNDENQVCYHSVRWLGF